MTQLLREIVDERLPAGVVTKRMIRSTVPQPFLPWAQFICLGAFCSCFITASMLLCMLED